jgi:LCP family protein required for cell wall assembly
LAKHDTPEFETRTTRPKRRFWRRIGLTFIALVIGFIAVVAGFSIVQHKSFMSVLLEPVVKSPQEVFGKDNLLVLVVGLDYDYTNTDQEYSTQARSDIIKAINLDFVHHQVYELDVPRDMLATMPDGHQAKINEAMSDGGIKEAQQVIAKWLGIPGFDRYVILRIDSMEQLIDAIGGVNVDVKDSNCLRDNECKNQDNLDYVDTWGHLNMHFKPGYQHLSGSQAVAYSRFRHDWCSDPCRLMRQAQVTQAMLAKIKSDKFNTLMHAGQLIDIVQKNTTTTFTRDELIALATYFSDIDKKDIHVKQVDYVNDINLPCCGDTLIPNTAERAMYVRTMLVSPPTPEPSIDPAAVTAIDPATLRVDVQNASGVNGAAHRLAVTLAKAGFKIGSVGDAPNDNRTVTEIHGHSKIAFAAKRVLAAMPASGQGATVVTDIGTATATKRPESSDVTVVVGTDVADAPNPTPSP